MQSLSQRLLISFSAIFLLLTANVSFFRETLHAYPPGDGNWLFLAAIALALLAVMVFVMSLFALLLPVRVVATLFVLLAAVSGYFTDQFGTIIDTVMIENTLQTDPAEVRDLLSAGFLMRVALLGVVSTVLIWMVPLRTMSLPRRAGHHGLTAAASLVVLVLVLLSNGDQFAGFFREHKALRTYTNPLTPIYSGIRYASHNAASAQAGVLATIAPDARIPQHEAGEEEHEAHELIILVVGETARRDHFSLNGYERKTNPLLEQEERLVDYTNISSCGTSTAISVPCMFAREGHNDFSLDDARHEENLLDILQRVGVSVLWRDNNSSSKGVADRVPYEDFKSPKHNPVCDAECRDVGMLAGLQEYIDKQPGDILIVLHQMGNHGPAYFKRYPPEFEHFTPACKSLDLSGCSQEEIVNAYDNAILYTDFFLSQVISLLKENTPNYATAMLYVSDHGESLGEMGLYLHGMPYMMAPKEQTEVATMLWLGESADMDLQQALALKDKKSSHDAVFNSVLTAFEVESEVIDRSNVLFQASNP
ncbi:phosphoethanolamine transferase [Pseudomaricurvus sp. HS19]|uniref:phosphoethanolamine transferase n=1 Tax=Pseudomaricurvus sp. HS19 TaxID=2692626 RepID=UPI00136F2DF6|nr:phosphoethanolamine--lipid A transferase [Pseudomaricurvus sp. HS19]MYM63457.1 phosphoethanolamine--lipid A transferase [Pseudomaricurvus sp. HS19]